MSRVSSTLESLKDIALFILLLAIGVSYHPTIIRLSRLAGYESGTILSKYILLLFGVVFILSIISKGFSFFRSRVMRVMAVMILLVGIVGLAAFAFFDNSSMMGDVTSLVIVFGAMIIGWGLMPSRRSLYLLFFAFIVSILFSAIFQVIVNIGGFTIEDQYLTDAKNSLGALLASASMLLLFIIHDSKSSFLRIISIFGVFLGLFLMLVIRSRMAFLTTGFLFILYFYLRSRSLNIIVIAYLFISVLIVGYLLLPGVVFDYVNSSMTAGTQGQDVFSGRIEDYREALRIFANNPFLGNISKSVHIGWVHNYPLLKLSSYGLLFSWPILILYVIILCVIVSRLFHCRGFAGFANLLMLVPFIISLAEPTFPFGPGTVTVFNFMLFGMADRALLTQTEFDL